MTEAAEKSFGELLAAAIEQVEKRKDDYPELLDQLTELRGMDEDEISPEDVRRTRIRINQAVELRGRVPRDFAEEDHSDQEPSPLAEFDNQLIELEARES